MRQPRAIALVAAALWVTACDKVDKQPALNPSMQTEEEDRAERGDLLNAVQQHPSLKDPSLAAPPISVSTEIPPPAAGSDGSHEHMDHSGQPAANVQDQSQGQ